MNNKKLLTMFGFGDRMKKCCHLELVSESDVFCKRGAMFGLDARIALAIFGALSVITGAALYSAIGNAKATAVLAEMREIGKAWEAYYLDTGVDLATRSADDTDSKYYSYKTADLVVDPSVSGWNGPYLSYSAASAELLDHPIYENVHLEKATDGDWSASQWTSERCDTSGEKCYVWVSINGIDNAQLATDLDKLVDGGDGAGSGNFRWVPTNLSERYSLKYAPVKNPKD